jgi:hypothetical protein
MRNELKSCGGRHRSPLYLATIVALLGAGAAGAADTTPMVPSKDGLLTLPNVRVVSAPQLATTPVAQAGMKAYIDPTTGQLRQPTQEELLAESRAGQLASTLQQQSLQQGTEFVTSSGAIGVTLGESSMVFSVVQKTDGGALAEFCVVGPEQAGKAMSLKAPQLSTLQRKEVRNDR